MRYLPRLRERYALCGGVLCVHGRLANLFNGFEFNLLFWLQAAKLHTNYQTGH